MEDFKLIVDKVVELMKIEVPVLGFRLSILTIVIAFSILSILFWALHEIFLGD